ncbi:MAG: hypothetical protein P8009_01955 [Gammaproteobacteria bacterium]
MNVTDQRILLSGPLDYLTFSQAPVFLTINGAARRNFAGNIVDREGEELTVQLDEVTAGALQEVAPALGEAMLATSYRSMRLEVGVQIVAFDQEAGQLTLHLPSRGILVDNRGRQRAKFTPASEDMRAVLAVETLTGEARFESVALEDFSFNAVSLYLDRADGLALPNDPVLDLQIQRGDCVLLQATGRVMRINKRAHAGDDRETYFAAIQLDDPNKPPVLDIEPNKRHSDRVTLSDRQDAFVEFEHPFLGSTTTMRIIDLSNSGLSAIIENPKHALPAGLVIPDASLQLPLRSRLPVTLQVRAYHIVGGDNEQTYRVSMAFMDATPPLIKEVSGFVQQSVSEMLTDANSEDEERLWEFYFETSFIYEAKRRHMQPTAEAVRDTFSRLLSSNTPLLKKILYKEDGVIKGHVTAVKVFDHALLVQHLNALKAAGGSAAMSVIRGMTSFFFDQRANLQSSNRYVCAYYRPNNLYPSLVFGETANLIDDPAKCWTQDYQFCVVSDGAPKGQRDANVVCREGTDEDKERLETLLIESGALDLIRVEGLSRDIITDQVISEEFEQIGLYRYRRLLVAEDSRTGETAYAVCSFASPGLNFSELTNSVRFFYSGETDRAGVRQALADALSPLILEAYGDTPIHEPVLLTAEGQPVPAGFVGEKVYTLWVLDLMHVKKFRDATEHIFSHLKNYIRDKLKAS